MGGGARVSGEKRADAKGGAGVSGTVTAPVVVNKRTENGNPAPDTKPPISESDDWAN